MNHIGEKHHGVSSRRVSISDVRHFVTELLPGEALLAYVAGREIQGLISPRDHGPYAVQRSWGYVCVSYGGKKYSGQPYKMIKDTFNYLKYGKLMFEGG